MDELGVVGHWNKVEADEIPDSERSKQILAFLAEHPEKLIHNAGPASNYEDERKLALILANPGKACSWTRRSQAPRRTVQGGAYLVMPQKLNFVLRVCGLWEHMHPAESCSLLERMPFRT